MLFAEDTWIRIPAFGVDFTFHVDKPTRIWMAGGDPYEDKEKMFSYPPIVTRLFMWGGPDHGRNQPAHMDLSGGGIRRHRRDCGGRIASTSRVD